MQILLTRIDLVVVGSLAAANAEAVADYERRIGRYCRLHVHELKGEPLQRGAAHVLQVEGGRIAAALDSIEAASSGPTTTIALDRSGKHLSSEQLAHRLLAVPHLCLVIGGAAGIAPEILGRCSWSLSLGALTLPHQVARLVLVEQLYRCWRIGRNEPYHH